MSTNKPVDEDAASRAMSEFLRHNEEQAMGAAPAAKPRAEPEPPPLEDEPAGDEPQASADNVRELPPPGSKEREDFKRKRKKGGKPPPPRQFKRLPEDCPVIPLGLNGDLYSFLDANGQLIERSASWLNQIGIDALFTSETSRAWLEENYPRIGEGGRVNGIDREAIRASLMVACGELSKGGVFQSREMVRGAGAWSSRTGDTLWWHEGDKLRVRTLEEKPRELALGRHAGFVYPLSQLQPSPEVEGCTADGTDSAAEEVLALLRKWRWERGDLDATLMLGWICCAMVGGALAWRTAGWVLGPPGSGKSTLQRIIRALLGGDLAIIAGELASAASTWQRMERMALPVLMDELEADADNRAKMGLVELMRQAASGGLISRGGADHKPLVFRMRSSFLFSSVNPLPLQPQDETRLVKYELLPLPEGDAEPDVDLDRIELLGRRLRARLMHYWPQWKGHLRPWWDAINKGVGKQGQRAADTYGTVLAMAHMMQFETLPDDSDLNRYLDELVPAIKLKAEQTGSDSERMLKRLCAKAIKVEEGEYRATASMRALIYIAADRFKPSDLKPNDPDADLMLPNVSAQAARRILATWGLAVAKIRTQKGPDDDGDPLAPGTYIAMPLGDHTELSKVFMGTHWQSAGWLTPAKRLEGAGRHKVRFGPKTEWGMCIPLRYVLDDVKGPEGGPEEENDGA